MLFPRTLLISQTAYSSFLQNSKFAEPGITNHWKMTSHEIEKIGRQ